MGDEPVFTHGDRLVHESPECDGWMSKTGWVLLHEDALLYLSDGDGGMCGDWDSDEVPNCPSCGENLYIETAEGVLLDPWIWWYPEMEGGNVH